MTPRQYARAQAIANDERADPNERANARRLCAEHEAIHGRPATTHGLRPWWTLKIAIKGSHWWLENTREFRRALRALRDGHKQYQYSFEWDTVKAVQDGKVDWVWFPESEPWTPPREMLRAWMPTVNRAIGKSEQVVEWATEELPRPKLGTPRRRGRVLRYGELPGRRTTKKR